MGLPATFTPADLWSTLSFSHFGGEIPREPNLGALPLKDGLWTETLKHVPYRLVLCWHVADEPGNTVAACGRVSASSSARPAPRTTRKLVQGVRHATARLSGEQDGPTVAPGGCLQSDEHCRELVVAPDK